MSPKTYETFRNELINLLNKALALDSVNQDTKDVLARICRKTQENQFKIVLAGEFQGGKSTTFNAFCDGREFCPTGSGIKTSGCIVSAQNISDSQQGQRSQIKWRNSQELVSGFSDLLLPHLKTLEPKRFAKLTGSDIGKHLNLDNRADRELVSSAADMEWEVWKKDKSGYDPEHKGLLDVLRCAALTAFYYSHETLKKLQNQNQFSPENIGKMAVFPIDWEQRWQDNKPEKFNINEILFIFIKHIHLKLYSDNLGRMGCVIVDCPGLFASRWDTETARKAMFDADAILYLFDGSKTLKLSDLNALEFIRKNGMEYKLFYGCNMRSHSLENSKKILQASITSLQNNGFHAHEAALFHALLALRAVQSESFFKKKSYAFKNNEKKLFKDIQRQIAILDIDNCPENFSQDFVDFAKNISGFNNLMEMVEKFIISRKARSILIENGSKMAGSCLLEAEGDLQNREENAFKKERDFRIQAANVEMELRKFKGKCNNIIERLEDFSPDYALGDNIWEQLENRQLQLCNTISEKIYQEVVNKFSLSLFARKKFQDKITNIIKSEIDEYFTEIINAWVAEIKDGKNSVYNARIASLIKTVSRELKNIWNLSLLSEMDLLKGIELPEFSGDLDLDTGVIIRELETGHSLENIRYNAILAAGGVTGIFTATSGILIAVYMLLTRLFWIRIATVVVFIINIIIMVLTRGLIEKSLKDEIKKKLSSAINMLFFEIKEDVKKEFHNFSKNIRIFYKQIFEKAVDRPRQIFEERTKQAESDFKETRDSRLAIAKQAKKIRQEQIQPLRIEIQNFTDKVNQAEAKNKPEVINDTNS